MLYYKKYTVFMEFEDECRQDSLELISVCGLHGGQNKTKLGTFASDVTLSIATILENIRYSYYLMGLITKKTPS